MSLILHLKHRLFGLGEDESGASLVEYALLVALIALVAIVAVTTFGGELSSEYSEIADSMP